MEYFPLYKLWISFIKSKSMANLEFTYIHSSNCPALINFKNMYKEQQPNEQGIMSAPMVMNWPNCAHSPYIR